MNLLCNYLTKQGLKLLSMKNNFITLPDGYVLFELIDLQKNKKQALIVNGLSLVLLAISVVVLCFMPTFTNGIKSAFDNFNLSLLLKLAVLLVGSIAYIVLHELTHALVMRLSLKSKIKFGFTGLYAFAGSDGYYNKKSYVLIALAPVLLFLVIFTVMAIFVSPNWLWVVAILQIQNVTGASGDIYVSCKMTKMPKNVLIHDDGVSMKIYNLSE